MRIKALLVIVISATAAVTLLARKAPAPPRSARTTPVGEERRETPGKEDTPETARPRLVDATTGDPVAGAPLAFHVWPSIEPPETAVTDENGRFDIPQDDPWCVVVRADGYPPTMFYLFAEHMEFRLDRGESRTFTIVDEEGNPGSCAEVDVYGDHGLTLLFASERADGRGVVTLWLGGRETILVRLPGYAYEEAEGPLVVLKPGFSIGGQVVDSAGRPVEGACVRVSQGGG